MHPEELEGTWTGRGDGSYPTIAPFAYLETLEVVRVPERPVWRWTSRTRDEATGAPRHGESGFLRAVGDDDPGRAPRLDLLVAHSFGAVEISSGVRDDGGLVLRSLEIHGAPGTKAVAEVVRRLAFDDGALVVDVAMAAVGVELTHHLAARLQRG